ncbi:MAG: asparagine synthase-related protein, partial [Acidobacteriota bacterium]|nr:asparagine synthase-related protein [Acidobacteriota bacterium]
GAMNSAEETLYRGILRLPPAHCLSVEAEKIEKRRYFDIDPGKEIRYRDDSEYAERFLEILNEAVRCRLRSCTPVGVTLSGGLDSSSVAALAAKGGRGSAPFEAFSLVFPGRSCDESVYIGHMLAHAGIRGNSYAPAELPASYYIAQTKRYFDFPDYPNGGMAHELTAGAREKGFRVLLTGLGGDEWLMGSFYHYADLLRRFRIRDFVQKLRTNAELSGPRFSWRTILRFGLWPLAPGWLQSRFAGALQQNRIPDWIEPEFARRAGLAERLRNRAAAPAFRTFAQRDLHSILTSGWRIHALEMENRAASSAGIEHRHPFSDRRVLEFALALPEEQRWRGDRTKFILREAMRSTLPEQIRLRQTKAEFSPVFTNTFRSAGGEMLFASLAISSLHWVNESRVRAKYLRMTDLERKGDPSYTGHACPLWMIYGINTWYQTAYRSEEAIRNV